MNEGKGIKHDVEGLFPSLIDELFQEKDIGVLYLFGSYGRGKPGILSDIDIAILLKI